MRVRHVTIGPVTYYVGALSMKFDEDLQYAQDNNTFTSFGSLGPTMTATEWTSLGKELVSISCTNTSQTLVRLVFDSLLFLSETLKLTDSPFIVLQTFDDPFPTLVQTLFPQFRAKQYPSNEITVVVFLRQQSSIIGPILPLYQEDILSCAPKISFNSLVFSSTKNIPNSVTFSQITESMPKCNFSLIDGARNSFKLLQYFIQSVADKVVDTVGANEAVLSSFLQSDIFQDLSAVLSTQISTSTNYSTIYTTACPYSSNDTLYNSDPCCNSTSNTQKCCAPRFVTISKSIYALKQLTSTWTSSFTGLFPSQIQFILADYIWLLNSRSISDSNDSDYKSSIESVTNLYSICNTKYGTITPCESDSECPYGVTCSSYGTCQMNIHTPLFGELVLNCTLSSMSPQLLNLVKKFLNISLNSTFSRTLMEFQNSVSGYSCFGSSEGLANGILVNTVISPGNIDNVISQGNQSQCEESTFCNYNHQNGNCESGFYCGSCYDPNDENTCTEEPAMVGVSQSQCLVGKCMHVNGSITVGLDKNSCNSITSCSGTCYEGCSGTVCSLLAESLCVGLCTPIYSNCVNQQLCISKGSCSLNPGISVEVPNSPLGYCVSDPPENSLAILCLSTPLFPGKCVTLNVTPTQCLTGGNWYPSSPTTFDECNSFGSVCVKNGIPIMSSNSSECIQCGGAWLSRYQWNLSTWKNSSLVPLYWIPRKSVTKNNWTYGVVQSLLKDIVGRIATSFATKKLLNKENQFASPISSIFRVLSCGCSSDISTSEDYCFGKREKSFIGSITSGILPEIKIDGFGSVQLCDNCSNAFVDVDVDVVTASFYAQYSSTKRSTSSSGSYTVVKNGDSPSTTGISGNYGNSIGQIIGNGIHVSGNGNLYRVNVSLEIRNDISIEDSSFTEFVFSTISSTFDDEIIVQDCPVTKNGNTVSCMITSDGTYFPALVRPDWRTYYVNVPSGISTSSSTSSTTSYTTSDTTSDSTSDSTANSSYNSVPIETFLLLFIFLSLFF